MSCSALVVDDDPGFLTLAVRILDGVGISVVATAVDGAQAVIAANATQPEAVLVDVGLPDRDGVDLAYELAALPWAPRVVLTSTDSDALGAIDRKPRLPFLPKEELANGGLCRLLMCR
jgi:CheY-like chemotaxis protein